MKPKNQYLHILLFLMFFNFSFSQEVKQNFEINISISKNQIVFDSNGGCNFIKLSASHKEFAMNQNGMINLKADRDEIESSKFIFTVERRGGKINLKGIKNTKWEELNLELNSNSVATITENGLKSKN